MIIFEEAMTKKFFVVWSTRSISYENHSWAFELNESHSLSPP